MRILYDPVVRAFPALFPSTVFRFHEVRAVREKFPRDVFPDPVDAVNVVPRSDWYPIATLSYAVLLTASTAHHLSASKPIAILEVPRRDHTFFSSAV